MTLFYCTTELNSRSPSPVGEGQLYCLYSRHMAIFYFIFSVMHFAVIGFTYFCVECMSMSGRVMFVLLICIFLQLQLALRLLLPWTCYGRREVVLMWY